MMPSSLYFLHRLGIICEDGFSLCVHSFNVCLFCKTINFMTIGILPVVFMVVGLELRTVLSSVRFQEKCVE